MPRVNNGPGTRRYVAYFSPTPHTVDRILINFRESDVSNYQQKERGHEYERRVSRHQWTRTTYLELFPYHAASLPDAHL